MTLRTDTSPGDPYGPSELSTDLQTALTEPKNIGHFMFGTTAICQDLDRDQSLAIDSVVS